MSLYLLRESISEDALLRVFSRLVGTINTVADLVSNIKDKEDSHEKIGEIIPAIEGIKKRIEKITVPQSQWKNIKPNVTNSDIGDSWMEFKATLVRRMLPEIIISLKSLSQSPIDNVDAKIAIANTRIQNLQQLVVGLAPESGVSDAEDMDNMGDGTDMVADPVIDTSDGKTSAVPEKEGEEVPVYPPR